MKRALAFALVAVLALAGTALAAASFKTGTYKGKTKQKQPITVVLGKHGMKSAKYKANFTCQHSDGSTGHVNAVQTKLGPAPYNGKAGHVDGKFGDPNDTIHFVATAKRKKMTGYLKETYLSQGGSTCTSGKVKFTIKHK
jgi:hypothetical protein